MMFFYISITFIKGHLRLKKALNFYRLQNWKKSSVLGLNVSSLFPNWHFLQCSCVIENSSPQTTDTPNFSSYYQILKIFPVVDLNRNGTW